MAVVVWAFVTGTGRSQCCGAAPTRLRKLPMGMCDLGCGFTSSKVGIDLFRAGLRLTFDHLARRLPLDGYWAPQLFRE